MPKADGNIKRVTMFEDKEILQNFVKHLPDCIKQGHSAAFCITYNTK